MIEIMNYLPVIWTALTAFSLGGLVILFYQRLNQRRPQTPIESLTEQDRALFDQSIKKSQDIISQSEVESTKLISEVQTVTTQLEQDYRQKLDANLAASEKQFEQYLADLKTKSEHFQTAAEQGIEQRLNAWFEQLENRISEFLVQNEQKTVESIELEMRSTRQLIETYKTQQLSLIDENIVAMMEKTLSMVLNKKLTLKDQVDLVYESLEKAKVEKFII